MTPEELIEAQARHQVLLERVKTGFVREYEKRSKKIDDAVVAIITSHKQDQLNKLPIKTVHGMTDKVSKVVSDNLGEYVDSMIGQMKELAGDEASFEADAIRGAVEDAKITAANAAAAYSAAINSPIGASGKMLKPFLREMSTKTAERLNAAILKGYANGETTMQTARSISGTRKSKGVIDTVNRNNASIIRTATQHLSQTSRMATWAANTSIVVGYEWVSTLDSRTSKICKSLDGQVFKIGEGPVPPKHVNCRSTTAPVINDKYKMDLGDAERASTFGPVDAEETYFTWLKRQSKAFQVKALGPTRAKLFRDGGLTSEQFRALQLDSKFEPMTLAEMRSANPLAFERAGL